MKRIISAAAATLLLAGAAFAQTDPAAKTGDPGAADKQMSITDPKAMEPFFTDESMGTMRPMADITAAWKAMSAENQAAIKEQCKMPEAVKMKEFCGAVGSM